MIGKGGSQLHQLQDETGCKVAIAPSKKVKKGNLRVKPKIGLIC